MGGARRTFGRVEATTILRVGDVLGEGILSELYGNIACNIRSVFHQSLPRDGVQQAVFRLYKKANEHQPFTEKDRLSTLITTASKREGNIFGGNDIT